MIRIIPFLKRFFLYLTFLFLVWAPIGGKYFTASVITVDMSNFFFFYLPLNYIPFAALILATGLERKKTIKILIVGFILIIIFNATIVFLQLILFPYQEQLLYIYGIGRIAFPFLLWVIFTYGAIFSNNND